MSTDIALSVDEEADLADYEQVIQSGLRTFVEVGEALSGIRERKLYRQTHVTFEAYCEQQWQLTRRRAYQMMEAASVVAGLSTSGTQTPTSERQARELSGLEPEVAAEVMTAAAEAGPVTAKTIAEHREQIAPRTMPVAKVTETTKTETFVNTDTGEVVEPVKPTVLPVGHTADDPAAIAAAAQRAYKQSPWPVFADKAMADLRHWREWLDLPEIGGAPGVVESLCTGIAAQTAPMEMNIVLDEIGKTCAWLDDVKTAIHERLEGPAKLRAVK